MTIPPSLRKLTLTVHLTTSGGWVGAVVAYLILVLAAMNSQEVKLLRTTWAALDLIGWYAIVPLALSSLLTGILQALGTKWGLFRHYWVLLSLVLTLVAVIILIQHMPTVSGFANLEATLDNANVSKLREGLRGELIHAGIGLVVLLVIQVLNVYKPQGLTPYGWRKHIERRVGTPQES